MLLELLIGSFWLALAFYCFWYFFLAKTVQPLTLEDVGFAWQLHKKQAGCNASRLPSLLEKNNEVVGFKCECGYKFQQKRLITQKVREPAISLGYSEVSHSFNAVRKLEER